MTASEPGLSLLEGTVHHRFLFSPNRQALEVRGLPDSSRRWAEAQPWAGAAGHRAPPGRAPGRGPAPQRAPHARRRRSPREGRGGRPGRSLLHLGEEKLVGRRGGSRFVKGWLLLKPLVPGVGEVAAK